MSEKIYLDHCCFNRPFDNQHDIRVRLETEAKLEIQRRIEEKAIDLVWSYILEYENTANPFDERRDAIQKWKNKSVQNVQETPEVIRVAKGLLKTGIKSKDSLHVACAMAAGCQCFLTTDDDLIKKMRGVKGLSVMDPTAFIVSYLL